MQKYNFRSFYPKAKDLTKSLTGITILSYPIHLMGLSDLCIPLGSGMHGGLHKMMLEKETHQGYPQKKGQPHREGFYMSLGVMVVYTAYQILTKENTSPVDTLIKNLSLYFFGYTLPYVFHKTGTLVGWFRKPKESLTHSLKKQYELDSPVYFNNRIKKYLDNSSSMN